MKTLEPSFDGRLVEAGDLLLEGVLGCISASLIRPPSKKRGTKPNMTDLQMGV